MIKFVIYMTNSEEKILSVCWLKNLKMIDAVLQFRKFRKGKGKEVLVHCSDRKYYKF